MLDSLENSDRDTIAGLDAVTSAATAAFRREVEKAYARGYRDALGVMADFATKQGSRFGEIAGSASESSKGATGNSGGAAVVRTSRKKVTSRARPGEIGRKLDELFADGRALSITEAHSALEASGFQASREGVAQELRNNTAKYHRRDDKRYYVPASDSGVESGAGAPDPNDIFSI